jgi:hypothetical protein
MFVALVGIGRVLREPTVHTAAAMMSVPAATAGMRAFGVSTDLDSAALAHGLMDGNLWFTLGMAAGFGALGGVISELLSLHGNIELPHRVRRSGKRSRLADPRDEVDLGIVSRLLLGAAAALAVLAIYAPGSPTALLVNALIAGSAATGVLRLVQGRMLGKSQPAAKDKPRPINAPFERAA